MAMENNTGIRRREIVLGMMPGLFHRPGFLKKPIEQLSGVEFQVLRYSAISFRQSPRRYLMIHGDEDTARDVLISYMDDHDGVAFIVTGKTREVMIEGAKIDPNRMFSRPGAEASVKQLNPGTDAAKVASALDFLDDKHQRELLLKHLLPQKGSRLVALHNNRDYSVNDEIAASDQTSIREPKLPRHFFLCTDPKDYEVLKQSPYNVVLQSKPDPDDGSLSRLAARRGFRYINLECAIGEYEAQQERLRWLDDRLP
jgi:hypothetical protein